MAKKRRGKLTRMQRNLAREKQVPDPNKKADPLTMVIQRGKARLATKKLKVDLRNSLRPLTALKLKDTNRNVLKDFVEVCSPLGVTHMMILSSTDKSHWLKMMKVPQGPTISFRIVTHSLAKDVTSRFSCGGLYDVPPLVVLTGFTSEKHHKLATTMVQKMFPSIKPNEVDVHERKRVLLLDYNEEEDLIRFRQYGIGLQSAGVNRNVRAMNLEKLPKGLDGMTDISEVITRGGYGSDSEGEDVEIADGPSRKKQKVKLRELGPRMDLELVKIEQGMCDGLVLYHKFEEKSLEEIAETERRREKRASLKAMRKKEQEENIERKRKEKEKLKKKMANPVAQANAAMEDIQDDDEQYYRDEVGEDPDEHFGVKAPRSDRAPFRRRRNPNSSSADRGRRGGGRGNRDSDSRPHKDGGSGFRGRGGGRGLGKRSDRGRGGGDRKRMKRF
ncbi:hypothetical protein BSKO_03213 [Bryopsis sp. KO-2023]|nr:hypothetical protein BSKO_03213 [Bryopsis sp. KO-2023]